MKITLILLLTFFLSFTSITDNPIDRLGVKGPVEFNNTKFKLAWTDHPTDNYYIQEYLIEGEKLDSFNQMVTVHLFNTNINLKDAVGKKIEELAERKKSDAVCNYKVSESPDGSEFIVDFLLGESKDNKMTIVEFNVYRYKQIEIAKKKKAIVVYAYSKRSYGDDITTFFKSLREERTKYLNQMISAEIPVVTIEN